MIRTEGIASRALAALSGSSGLARYEAACRAIAEARSVDEVKAIRDTAEAMRAAAHVAKNKQAEIDMAEIRFRGERRLGELMAAQKAEHGTAQGRRTDLGFSETQVGSAAITLAESGIDKNLADRARKFAAIPEDEFDHIVGDWRERVADENERVTTSLLKAGDRAEQGRRENDFYPTPESLIAEIALRWKPSAKTIWEPCVGDGRVASALRVAGYEIVSSDISQGQDFFACDALPLPGIALCTNPPFGRVREFIDHAFAIGVKEMCLVLPERIWASGIGREQFRRHRPSMWINMDWREDYLGKGGSPDRALAVAIWNGPCAASCVFDVWTRGATVEAFDHETGELTDTQESVGVGILAVSSSQAAREADETAAQDDVGSAASSTNPHSQESLPPADTAGGVVPPAPPATHSGDDLEIPEFLRRTEGGYPKREAVEAV